MLQSKAISVILGGASLLWIASPLCGASQRLERLIENVRANEALYHKIEASTTESYELLDPDAKHEGLVKTHSKSTRTVLQGSLLYFRKDQTYQLADGTTRPHNCRMGYDGEYTRRVEEKLANLIHGPSTHCQLFRPHAWLFSSARVCFPLSVWLTGGKELQNHPNAGNYRDGWVQSAVYENEEEVEGLHTVKLRAETRGQTGKLITVRYVWLATDRNYLPVKSEARNVRWSDTLPVEVDRATDFREIAPGVWLPFHRATVIYSEMKLSEGKMVLGNKTDVTLTMVNLEPNYDMSLFRDIPFPDGAHVYEYKDGKMINQYKQGEVGSSSSQAKGWRWLWVVGPSLALTLIGFWLACRRHARVRATIRAA
jgi:hypothetical protein